MSETTTQELEENVPQGAFLETLKRTNKKIREDRAATIAEETEMKYRRKIEDLQMEIRNMQREQQNMLDLSPTDAQSLILASDFDADGYIDKDVELGVKIRNSQIKLEIAQARYEYLFGEES